ncbi:MAG: response regulator [Deltaproteobacteria bacterium]|nr:response regulator [Deltaproteobacteria bacterium]
MSVDGHVLIIDDEKDLITVYREILAEEGYTSFSAMTKEEALTAVLQPGCAVILLDQRLRGAADTNSGLDLLKVLRSRAPAAKVIVVTGYADPDSARRAFVDGAWDYLQKDRILDPLLRTKVRNAMEVWRERSLAALSAEKREAEIADLWTAAQKEGDANKKGSLLEQLLLRLFRTVPGFEHATANRVSRLEEIDVLVQNSAADPFWQKEGNYILIECKNWSGPVGVPELKLFRQKIEDRYGRAALGFLIALGGYSETTKIEEWTRRSGDSLVVLLDAKDLGSLVGASDRNAELKRFHERQMLGRSE